MIFDLRFSAAADDDLARLFDFLLDKAKTLEDLDVAQAAIEAVRSAALRQWAVSPYSFRQAGASPTRRELIISFGATGYVALHEIASPSAVVVLALRHQREEDCH
jgi:plasmid stabilization system protein ParE